ncbi:MAG: NUDIX hydrolase [Thermoleophilia bacterium]|nr:NUDIX hydrolase [Gaiellaceae bacterium]MDW8338749.1 NUDIX hydrolase [Thermoleophilia bacterium]
MIRAAGGVVVRERDGVTEVLVIHRPRYGDWTFPKGKAEPGEPDEACALREVEEETGLRCELGEELPATEYVDGQGREKRVRYWRMHPLEDRIELRHEVDDARWLALPDARELLTYARDVALLDALEHGS